jgi:hypothetical protein
MMDKSMDERVAFALRNVDTKDLEWLSTVIAMGGHAQSGHGRLWRTVIHELDTALRDGLSDNALPHLAANGDLRRNGG